MRSIAVIGAGQSGTQLALGLLEKGYDVTLVTDREPDQVRTGPVMSSQCMFDTALRTERALGLDDWQGICPQISGISLSIGAEESNTGVQWSAPLDAPAQSVDQRVKCAAWLERYEQAGGKLVVRAATLADLEEYARTHELVVVATGKGELGRIFPRDSERSPYDRPRRVLALTYVTGAQQRPGDPVVDLRVLPGVGEYFTFPALTVSGPCEIMVFEGVPGGPMDCWDGVRTPEEHLTRSLEILKHFFPDEYERCRDARLTDDNAVLRGRLTPTVRRPVAQLPSGRHVLGLADAVVLCDPVTGQGSNNAAQAAEHYLDSILRHGAENFTPTWMQRTFDGYWRGWAQWSVAWTNGLLEGFRPHQRSLLTEAAEVPGAARALVNGFDDPRTLYPWWSEPAEAERMLAEKRAVGDASFDVRDLRRAFGQYATGVTVVTARGADGRKVGMTANSFTSVSLDPPLVLWCPGKNAPSTPDFTSASHFAINILAADQHHLSRQFATPAEDKFAGAPVDDGIAGTPVLEGAVARFQCRTVQCLDVGDHIVMIGEVEQYDAPGGEPLVFHSGLYHLAAKHPDL
ncbi:flavin oxidoreductase [Streptomyces sp. Ru71]|uniref:styrene monooxygenase/indole monooxygenase family protein n=1 Tax=Streptomyces sp. Ru71 TaxID=2080746 RepID=UPI000CDE24FB|nr:styrene monooxygenase/indole monooxygenase family protein [Streptomyces sp. Ru71]POX48179.1 flavin oxidoreductase [Streptomyces sp. Ru71]